MFPLAIEWVPRQLVTWQGKGLEDLPQITGVLELDTGLILNSLTQCVNVGLAIAFSEPLFPLLYSEGLSTTLSFIRTE